MELPESFKEHLRSIAAKGGSVSSRKKRKAARLNLIKANAAKNIALQSSDLQTIGKNSLAS